MKYDPERHHRRSIRLQDWDYAGEGAYFVTICTHERLCLFGEAVDGEIRLNEYGQIARACWEEIPLHFSHAQSDVFVVMPNHVHGIIILATPVGARHAVPLQGHAVPLQWHAVPLQNAVPLHGQNGGFGKPVPGSIPTIIRSFKSAVTKRVNALRDVPGVPVWQRNYYEHIIRNERELTRISEYIMGNPANWETDDNNPDFARPQGCRR